MYFYYILLISFYSSTKLKSRLIENHKHEKFKTLTKFVRKMLIYLSY